MVVLFVVLLYFGRGLKVIILLNAAFQLNFKHVVPDTCRAKPGGYQLVLHDSRVKGRYGDMSIWWYGDMVICLYGDMVICLYGDMVICLSMKCTKRAVWNHYLPALTTVRNHYLPALTTANTNIVYTCILMALFVFYF